MASLDIGIDLGTSTILASDSERQMIIKEPSVVAIDHRYEQIIGIGVEVEKMIGRAPGYIEVIRPLQDGVISDYKMTEALIRHLLRQICYNQLLKPRVTVCVPSQITDVESQAVIDAAVAAGARKVYLMEEPVAAAIGAGIELSRPDGNLIVDIGGGTTDVAALSLNGIVCKASLRVAGKEFDEAIIKYMRSAYALLIGEKTAEYLKMEIGSVYPGNEDKEASAKGRDLMTGLPRQIPVRRSELMPILGEVAVQIVRAVQGVIEQTPPELVGDFRTNGMVLTGGGALLDGFDKLLAHGTRMPARVAENAVECVAVGTARSFDYLGKLFDGFINVSVHEH